jgi:hypothetical protein
MAATRISVDFSTHKYSDKELSVAASTVSTKLSDNVNFPTLKEVAAQIEEKTTTLDTFLSQMSDGNKEITAQKNAVRAELEKLLRSTALKVEDLSEGDEVKLLSSGFALNKSRQNPVGTLAQVQNVKAKLGTYSGSLDLSWDIVEHAVSYEVRYTPSPRVASSVFQISTCTRRKTLLEGLTVGLQYVIQVAAVGADTKRAWSVEITTPFVS